MSALTIGAVARQCAGQIVASIGVNKLVFERFMYKQADYQKLCLFRRCFKLKKKEFCSFKATKKIFLQKTSIRMTYVLGF